jgi:hypothetical protein
MANLQKDLLFYSNYSEYCKSLINTLVKKNIRDKFLLVCVDRKELKIPAFVNRVPCILTATKELYMDENIQTYIDSKLSIMQQKTEVAPFMFGNALNSSQYTFLTADGNEFTDTPGTMQDMIQSQNFVVLDRDDPRISAPIDVEAEQKGASKMDSSLLERYMNMRKYDDENIKKMMNTGNGGNGNAGMRI